MGDQLTGVPPESFNWRGQDTLSLNTTKENLANAPHFTSSQWPEFNQDQAAAVYRNYNVPMYFETAAPDNTAQNRVNGATPIDQGNSPEDIRITRDIRQQIMNVQGLSINARNVKIMTLNGHVTLRGVVNSQSERDQIDDIAKKVASAGNVTDELQVQRPQALNTLNTQAPVITQADK
jgi:hypothetical protein